MRTPRLRIAYPTRLETQRPPSLPREVKQDRLRMSKTARIRHSGLGSKKGSGLLHRSTKRRQETRCPPGPRLRWRRRDVEDAEQPREVPARPRRGDRDPNQQPQPAHGQTQQQRQRGVGDTRVHTITRAAARRPWLQRPRPETHALTSPPEYSSHARVGATAASGLRIHLSGAQIGMKKIMVRLFKTMVTSDSQNTA